MANTALQQAGYAKEQINNALKSGWNTSVDALGSAANALNPTKW
ncbi:MAG TPA: hypothetical protein VF794_41265 [Archangium sp.]